MGCVSQVGEQGWNIGRMAPLVAGWPELGPRHDRRPAVRLVDAVRTSTPPPRSGRASSTSSSPAGVESMSRVPMGSSGGDLSPKLLERWEIVPQGISAELIAERVGALARGARRVLVRVAPRARCAAIDEGRFEREVVPVEVSNPHTGVVFGVDETPRADTSPEALAALKPAFLPDGKVTAGNSSQICDGAAAVLVASEAACSRLGLEPRARFVSFGLVGVDPRLMLHGNPQACERALARAGLGWDDIAVVEVNEAFASVALQFMRDTGLEERWADVNPNGGGISLGHPLGATGARVTATLLTSSSAATRATAWRRCASASARRSPP